MVYPPKPSKRTYLPNVRPLTLGVEVEALASGLVKGEDIYEKVAKAISSATGLPARYEPRGYTEGEPAWIVTSDQSLANTISIRGFELISPILEDTEGESDDWEIVLATVINAVKDAVKVSVDQTTGLHVHVGVGKGCDQEFTLEEAKRVAILLVLYEGSLDRLHPEHRSTGLKVNPHVRTVRGNWFLAPVKNSALCDTILSATSIWHLTCLLNPSLTDHSHDERSRQPLAVDRYYKYNFCSLQKHRTIEFRQHAGTVDPVAIAAWVRIVLTIVRKALGSTEDEVKMLDPSAPGMTLVPHIIGLSQAQAVKGSYEAAVVPTKKPRKPMRK